MFQHRKYLPLSIIWPLPTDVPLHLNLLHRDLPLVIFDRNCSSGGLDAHLPVNLAKHIIHQQKMVQWANMHKKKHACIGYQYPDIAWRSGRPVFNDSNNVSMNLGTVVKIVHHLESLPQPPSHRTNFWKCFCSTFRGSFNLNCVNKPKIFTFSSFSTASPHTLMPLWVLVFHIVQILKEDTINRKLYLIRRRLKEKLLPKSENSRPTDLCFCHSG